MEISWEPSPAPDLGHYLVYVRAGGGTYAPPVLVASSVLAYPLTGLEPGTTYCAALRAVDFAGNESDLSDEGCGTTPASTCGDGVLDEGEECDDGNTTGGDGCSDSCRFLSRPEPLSASELTTGLPYLPQCAVRWVKVTGRGFETGARVSFTDTSLLLFATQFRSGTELRVAVFTRITTPLGTKDLRVINPDTGTGWLIASGPTPQPSVEVIRNPNSGGSLVIGAEQLNALAIAFGSCDPLRPRDADDPPCPLASAGAFNELVDMDGDGWINANDLVVFAAFLGQFVQACPA